VYFNGGMFLPYDATFRGRAVKAYEEGDRSAAEVARIFGVAHRTLQRWIAQYQATGSVEPRAAAGGQRSRVRVTLLKELLARQPDATCGELTAAYNRHVPRAARVKWWTVWRALQRVGYVIKKNAPARPSKTGPTSNARAGRFAAGSGRSIPTVWYVSMKPGRN
jgi:transposase